LIKKRSFSTRGLEVDEAEAWPAPAASRVAVKQAVRPRVHARAVKPAPAAKKKSQPAKSSKPAAKGKPAKAGGKRRK